MIELSYTKTIECIEIGRIMDKLLKEKLCEIVGENNVLIGEMMKEHTTFRIGGPADYYITPDSPEQIALAVLFCKQNNLPYYIIGNGSNLLVGDYGFRGVIIEVGNRFDKVSFQKMKDGKYQVTAGAGILLSKLAASIAAQGLTGFEYASGIPGTLGGAVTMNAGAYGGEMKHNIVSASVLNEEGVIEVLPRDELDLGYRTSIIQKKGYIVIEAVFEFEKGDPAAIKALTEDLTARRKDKQPLEYASAGSTFKRPDGYYAGKLIMDSGLRGFKVGNIMISEKHCGFVINLGGGTAAEVLTLMDEVQRRVFEQFGVNLEPEVRIIGQFSKEA